MLYRLFMLDAQDRIVGTAEMLEAADDACALAQARSHPHRYAMELWDGERLVRLIERDRPGSLGGT